MQHILLWVDILTVILGAGVFASTYQSSKKQCPALKPLLPPILFYNILILLGSLSGYVHLSFFPDMQAFKHSKFADLLSPSSALLFLIFLYTAQVWIWKAADRKPPQWLIWVYRISPFLFVFFYSMQQLFFKDAGHIWEAFLAYYLILTNIVGMLLILMIFTIGGLNPSATPQARHVARMTLFYGVGMALWLGVKFFRAFPHQITDLLIPPAFNGYLLIWIPRFIGLKTASNGMHVDEATLAAFCQSRGVSSRQREIMALLLEGKNNSEIAETLFIARHTVKNHIYNLYQKLGLKNRMELVSLILSNGPDTHP